MTNSKGHCLTRALRWSYTKLVIRMIACICRYREGDDQCIFSLFDYQHIKQLRVRIRTRNRSFKKYTWNVFANSITYKRALVCKCPYNERLLWINSSVLQLGSMFSNNWACVTIVFIRWFRHCSIVVIWYAKLVCLQYLMIVNIAGTLGCVFIDNETHESGVTKCTTGEAWSAFSWHHSSVFHCQWTHNQVFLLLSHMLI